MTLVLLDSGDAAWYACSGSTTARSVYAVNSTCGSLATGYAGLIGLIQDHETEHQKIVVDEAVKSGNDPRKIWETLYVKGSKASLLGDMKAQLEAINGFILAPSDQLDVSGSNQGSYNSIVRDGSAWQAISVTLYRAR